MTSQKSETRYMCLHRPIWNDDKFPFVSDACQLVFFHVVSNPFGYLGIYKASVEALAAEKRKDVKDYRKGFDEGIREGFFEYDEKYHVIYIPNFQKYNLPQSPNVVKSFAKYFNEIPRCHLKQKYYDSFKEQMEDFGEAFQEAFRKAFREPFPEGLDEDLGKGYTKAPVTVTVKAIVTDIDPLKDKKKQKIVTDLDIVKDPFASNPQNVLDLWDDLIKPLGMPKAPMLSPGLIKKIDKAFKLFKTRDDWVLLFTEYPQSKWLRGLVGDRKKRDLMWLLQREYDGELENYIKVHNGRYRDDDAPLVDRKLQQGIDVGNQLLAKYGQPLIGENNDGSNGHAGIHQGLSDGGHKPWGDAESGANGNLLPRSEGFSTRESAGFHGVVEAECEPLPVDSGAEELYRGGAGGSE